MKFEVSKHVSIFIYKLGKDISFHNSFVQFSIFSGDSLSRIFNSGADDIFLCPILELCRLVKNVNSCVVPY